MNNYKENRPWGSFENLLDESYCKVKKLIIKPKQRPSYQYHHKRSEHWVIVSGEAVVTVDGVETVYTEGQSVYIPILSPHRIENKGGIDLIFIEVQTGTYFGEDDIVRVQDDYTR
jgi:mannose-6-phosphate isomerase